MKPRKHVIEFKRAQLAPYPGSVCRFNSWQDLRGYYEKQVGPYPYQNDEPNGGRFIYVENAKNASKSEYLVFGREPHVFAHELSHAILDLFKRVGIDPREGNGEPFCYLLSQLMLDLRK